MRSGPGGGAEAGPSSPSLRAAGCGGGRQAQGPSNGRLVSRPAGRCRPGAPGGGLAASPSPAPLRAPPATLGRLEPRHHGRTCTHGPGYVLTGLGALGHDLEVVINFSDFPFSQM